MTTLDRDQPDGRNPEILVLLSGGIDSAACAHFYRGLGRPLCAMHIQYGQCAAQQELTAASQIADFYGLHLYVRALTGAQSKSIGEVTARNAFLIVTAAMERPVTTRGIALGIHTGTSYADCSPDFVRRMTESFFAQGVSVEVLAPFIDWHKGDILQYCHRYAVPTHLTYSCERGGNPPCGQCLSCLDRRSLDARA